jgi:ubiquitin C-terminal hydrolase
MSLLFGQTLHFAFITRGLSKNLTSFAKHNVQSALNQTLKICPLEYSLLFFVSESKTILQDFYISYFKKSSLIIICL